MDSCVSVYVDWSATERDVRDAVEGLAMPAGVSRVQVACIATDTLGCRVAVDLIGAFDETAEGRGIARRCAAAVSAALGGRPAFALHDLMLAENSGW
jgi:hypothetical protein